MSGKFIVPIQLPLLFTKPDTNPAEGYYKLYLRDGKLRKMDWLGIEELIGGTEITTTQIQNWNAAYSWGDHAEAGYIKTKSLEGTQNFVPKFTNTNEIGNSRFYDDGTNIGINKTSNFLVPLMISGNPYIELHDYPTTNISNATLFFRGEYGFVRTNYYGTFSGAYNVGHQMMFADTGNSTSTAGLLNMSFTSNTGNFAAISNRPLITINNGAGAALGNTPVLKLMANGNLLLGLSTDGGQKVQVNGSVRATSFIVTSGTSSQFLKADGTLDSNTYLTTGGASGAYVSLSGSYANPSWITSLTWSKITGAPSFLTAESDTLDSVTDRGATTTNTITVGGITTSEINYTSSLSIKSSGSTIAQFTNYGGLLLGVSSGTGYLLEVGGSARFIGGSIKIGQGTGLETIECSGGDLISFNNLTEDFTFGEAVIPFIRANRITQQMQLSPNGSDVKIYVSTVGVGINTTPTEPLDVNGNALFRNNAVVEGEMSATVVKKTGGTSTQFLKADGSVDATNYATQDMTLVYAIALG